MARGWDWEVLVIVWCDGARQQRLCASRNEHDSEELKTDIGNCGGARTNAFLKKIRVIEVAVVLRYNEMKC